MSTIWFMIVAVMVAMYVLLDGFDIGAGAVHLIIARNDTERRTILRAIGPVWDGNEVWLLAAGGTLYFAFPLLYASSFSGFYLPLIIVLWLLMLRGIGIEFRSHIHDGLWTSFFDVIFSVASILLAIFFGAALGNVVRGVPLNADGYFFEPLWTNFLVGTNNGILDWYTVIMGVVALVTLVVHGSLYLATKTEGELNARARRVRVRAMAGAVAPHHRQSCCDAASASRHSDQLQQVAHRLPHSAGGRRQPGLSPHCAATEERQGRVPGFLRIHRRHAGGSGVRALSRWCCRPAPIPASA